MDNNYKAELKSVKGRDVIEGWLVKFTDANNPDVDGDYFDKTTNFHMKENEVKSVPLMFHHGMNKYMGRNDIGNAVLTRKKEGIYVKATLGVKSPELFNAQVLEERDEYLKFIKQLAVDGKLSWSSGAVTHAVIKSQRNAEGSTFIEQWFPGEASLTPTPAELNNNAEVKMTSKFEAKNTEETKAEGETPVASDIEIKLDKILSLIGSDTKALDEDDILKRLEALEIAVKELQGVKEEPVEEVVEDVEMPDPTEIVEETKSMTLQEFLSQD